MQRRHGSAISCLIDESPYEDEDQNCSSTRAVVLGLRKKTLTTFAKIERAPTS